MVYVRNNCKIAWCQICCSFLASKLFLFPLLMLFYRAYTLSLSSFFILTHSLLCKMTSSTSLLFFSQLQHNRTLLHRTKTAKIASNDFLEYFYYKFLHAIYKNIHTTKTLLHFCVCVCVVEMYVNSLFYWLYKFFGRLLFFGIKHIIAKNNPQSVFSLFLWTNISSLISR